MRRMSFALTTEQVLARTKTVTRRLAHTWAALKPGDLLLAVDKSMGLKKGEKSRVLAVVRVTDVRVEPLADITAEDVAREGFPRWTPDEFTAFLLTENGIKGPPDKVQVRRIAFEYVTGSAEVAALGEANQRRAGARKARERKAAKGGGVYMSEVSVSEREAVIASMGSGFGPGGPRCAHGDLTRCERCGTPREGLS